MSRSGIIAPDVYSYRDPQPIQVYGEALVSFGLEVRDGIDGYGLVSRGLLWELQAIWLDIQEAAPILTSWTASAGASIVTTWTAASGSSVSTSWTPSQFGIFGDYQS